jgi:hypothetical protein
MVALDSTTFKYSDQRADVPLTGSIQPVFIRLPSPGKLCPYTGLRRTAFYTLLKSGKVKTYTLKQPGSRRGIRLIDFASLVAAIKKEMV